MLCSVWDVVFVLSQKNEPWSARANSKHCDCLHTRSRIVVSVKSAITAIKVISYVYSNHFGVIFSPTKVAKVFFSAKKISSFARHIPIQHIPPGGSVRSFFVVEILCIYYSILKIITCNDLRIY